MNENEPQQEGAGRHEQRAEDPGERLEEAWQPRLWSKLILLVVAVGLRHRARVANSSKVKISFLFASINVSKIWLILLCLVLGLLTGVLLSQMHRHRRIKRAQLERQAEQSQQIAG